MKFLSGKINKLLSYSVYRKTLYAYSISVLVMMLIVLAGSFAIMVSNIQEQSLESSQQLLTQLVSSAETVKAAVDDMVVMIAGDSKTLRFAKNSKDNKLDNYYLYSKLADMKMAYNQIENITVINMDNGIGVSLGANGNQVSQATAEFVTRAQSEDRYIISRTVSQYQKTVNVVSFIKLLPYDNCAIIVDVNCDWFQYDLAGSGGVNRNAYVIDAKGRAVTNNARLQAAENLTTSEYLYGIVKNVDGKEYVYNDSAAGKMLFFEKTDKLGWWFVDIQDYSSFYKSFSKMAVIFLGIGLCFMVFSIIISVIFSKKIQRPLIQLVNKWKTPDVQGGNGSEDELTYIDRVIGKIEHERYRNESYLRDRYLHSLLLGQELPMSVSMEAVDLFKKELVSNYYAVILLKIHVDKELSEGERQKELKVLRYTLCNLAGEIFAAAFKCKAVEIGDDICALLLLLDNEKISDEYVVCYRQLSEFCQKQLNIQISGSLGSAVSDEIHLSYIKARQYLDIGELAGRGEIVDSNSSVAVAYKEKNQRLAESVIEYTKLSFSNADLSLKSLSNKFELSTAYLGKIFKSVTGESYSSYLTLYRLGKSKELLEATQKTVSEIAEEVGFVNSTYYTTLFKNSFGMTPTAFRGAIGK